MFFFLVWIVSECKYHENCGDTVFRGRIRGTVVRWADRCTDAGAGAIGSEGAVPDHDL